MSAYDFVDSTYLIRRLRSFMPDINIVKTDIPDYGFAKGLLTHYYVMKQEDYINYEKRICAAP